MIITSKKSINNGVKSMAAKAMSWNQVCKAISGIGGYVSISETEKVRPLELMHSLGVHVSKNSYKPKDIFAAWSERMKKDGKIKPITEHSTTMKASADTIRLGTESWEEYNTMIEEEIFYHAYEFNEEDELHLEVLEENEGKFFVV